MKFKPNTFVSVPNKHLIESMTPAAMAVYVRLNYRMNSAGFCYPSIVSLQEDTLVGKNGVYQAIKDLETLGVITKTARFNKKGKTSNGYQIMIVDDTPKKTMSRFSESLNDDIPISRSSDMELKPIELNITGGGVPPPETWTWEGEKNQLLADKSRPFNMVIVLYWVLKGITFTDQKQVYARGQYRRLCGVAKAIYDSGYSIGQIKGCMKVCNANFTSWSLDAVARHLPEYKKDHPDA